MTVLHYTRPMTAAPGNGVRQLSSFVQTLERGVTGEALRGNIAVRLWVLGGVVAAVSAGIGYIVFGPGEQHQLFRDLGPVSFFVVAQTLLVGLLGLLIAAHEAPASKVGRATNFWFLAGVGFLLLSFDAPLDLHGRLGEVIGNQTTIAEEIGFHRTSDAILAVYMVAGLAVATVYAGELLRHRRALLYFAAGAAFIGGTIVVDGFAAQGSWMWVFEETLEVFAAACFVGAFASRLQESIAAQGEPVTR
ncbi:MAG: hypothetical protein M0R74_17630 [Dehalococcoidia bacterium]|nr:hypothetical protein [Dehalococcoidia bacterium]